MELTLTRPGKSGHAFLFFLRCSVIVPTYENPDAKDHCVPLVRRRAFKGERRLASARACRSDTMPRRQGWRPFSLSFVLPGLAFLGLMQRSTRFHSCTSTRTWLTDLSVAEQEREHGRMADTCTPTRSSGKKVTLMLQEPTVKEPLRIFGFGYRRISLFETTVVEVVTAYLT